MPTAGSSAPGCDTQYKVTCPLLVLVHGGDYGCCYYRVSVSSQAHTLLPRGPGQPWDSSDPQQHQLYSLTGPKVA